MASSVYAQSDSDKAAARTKIGVSGPKLGMVAPDFSLSSADGQVVHLADLWRQRPVVVMTGSHTCPVFRRQLKPFETLAKSYAGKVGFLIIYTLEAHPKGDPSPYSGKEWVTPANEKQGLLIPQPKKLEERVMRAKTCVATEKISLPMVIDTMQNKVWEAYGKAPNCAYLIGTDGKIITAQPWMDAAALRAAIEALLKSKGR